MNKPITFEPDFLALSWYKNKIQQFKFCSIYIKHSECVPVLIGSKKMNYNKWIPAIHGAYTCKTDH